MKIDLLIENELFVESRIDYLRQQNANLPEFDQFSIATKYTLGIEV